MARARWREVPVRCLVEVYCGWVPVARVDAGGVGAGLVGETGGCAGEPCCEVGEAQFVHGVPDGYVGGCGWAGAVVVGAAFRSPMKMVGARRGGRRYARLRASGKSFVSSPNETCVSSTFSCHPGPTHSYAPRRPSTPRSGWACTVTDVLW